MLKKFRKIITLLIIFFGFFIFINNTKAADCGGEIVCACGDTVIASTTLVADLDCSDTVGNGLIIGANNIVINGMGHTITGTGDNSMYGLVSIYNSLDNVSIKNLNVTNFRFGIYLYNMNNSVIESVTVTSNFINGITLANSNSNILTNNTINSNRYDDIRLENSSSNTLTNNSMLGNKTNLYVAGQFNNVIDTTNKVEGKSVYYLYNNDGTIENPLVYDGDVLNNDIGMFWCISCEHVQVKNATLSANNYMGVYFYNTSSSTIDNVTANSNSSYGIYLENSSSNTITNNTANTNYSSGIYLENSSSNTLTGNTTNSSRNRGILIFNSSLNALINNTANSNSGYGFDIFNSSSSTITNNTVTNCGYGINISNSSSSIINNNIVNTNLYYGIYLENSSSNTLTNNSMLGNKTNLFVTGQFNNVIDTTNKVEGKSVYYLYNNDGTIENPLVYDGDVLNNDIGMFWCISCQYIQVKNATLSTNNYSGIYFYNTTSTLIENIVANSNSNYGIYLENTSSSTLINNIVNSNLYYGIYLENSSLSIITSNNANSNFYYGIYLENTSSSTLTNNSANLNPYGGIYLKDSFLNTLTNNSANSNSQSGVYIDNSPSNIFANNTTNLNLYYGIYVKDSSSNIFEDNVVLYNKYDIFDNGVNVYSSNNFSYNIISKMSTIEEIVRIKDVNDLVSFDISMFNIDSSACSDCLYSITTSPSEVVSTSKNANRVTGNFTATKSGMYSLIFIVTDSNLNTTKKRMLFLVGDIASQTTKYYPRGLNPIHGQPISIDEGNDAKSMLLTPATVSEEWDCSYWVQNSPDEIPSYPLSILSNINTFTWYKQLAEGWAYIGINRYATYDEIVDVSSSVPKAMDYTWINRNFTNLNWAMDYPHTWYWSSLKLTGDRPYWITFPSTGYSNQPSYVDFTYEYAITPAIKSISNENIVVLSATTPADATSSASIVLDNPNTSATSTTLVLTDFKRPFLSATSTIDSASTTSIATTIGSNGSSTLYAVAMDIVPSYGSISIAIDTWNTTGDYYKKWSEEGSDHDISTQHTIGDLQPDTNYVIKVNGISYAASKSNSLGEITFTYDDGYSVKTFELIEDTTAPTIAILGFNPVSIYVGSSYTDSGATASDSVDGNLTDNINITSNVNTNSIGSYIVNYVVSDSAGNTATSTRVVNVILRLGGAVPIHTLDIKPKKKQDNLIKDNQIFKYRNDSKIYLLENGLKRWIKDEYTFNKLGYKWSDIVILEEDENSYSTGEDLFIIKSAFQFTKILKLKSVGNDVIQLQTILKKLGYFTYPKITNYYGSYTADAVGRFQKANKLKITKTLDKETMKELNKLF